MNIQKPEILLSPVLPTELATSPSSEQLLNHDQQDEYTSDCPLLTPSPPPEQMANPLENAPIFNPLEDTPLEMTPTPTLENINSEDGLNAYMNIVNSSSKPLHDEPSSRDPMVESSTSGSSSDTNEPVCAQLLTQLNTAYQHLAPDAQALFNNQENGGKPPLVGIQLVVPKTPKNYRFSSWNWPAIRKTCFWSLMSVLAGCTALVIGVIATMPKRCDPSVEWWQGSVFYEIFPASFQDSSHAREDGIGDLRGIAERLDYLRNLGVTGIRLNSIFPAPHYPEYYFNVTKLTAVNSKLGTLDDFSKLVRDVHAKNMTLILDLPLHPFVRNFEGGNSHILKPNKTDKAVRERRGATGASALPGVASPPELAHVQPMRSVLSSVPRDVEPEARAFPRTSFGEPEEDNVLTAAIKFWLNLDVDGFYLKGLEHFVNEEYFVDMLRHWKNILGSKKILMCSMEALNAAGDGAARNVLLSRVDLVDVTLQLSNGTVNAKSQIEKVTKGVLFNKPGYPWVHWSIGSVDTKRVASALSVHNASIAAVLVGMMLPGTPNIFYGDEVGMMDCDCKDHQDLAHVHSVVPMFWTLIYGATDGGFTSDGIIPWLPTSVTPKTTNLVGTVADMAKLRMRTTPLYMNALNKDNEIVANCEVRYTADELIVIERWYPRRNSYVLVANLGKETQTKDLSFLYYGGHVVVGPKSKMNANVYFKELTIVPGEAIVVKLDK